MVCNIRSHVSALKPYFALRNRPELCSKLTADRLPEPALDGGIQDFDLTVTASAGEVAANRKH